MPLPPPQINHGLILEPIRPDTGFLGGVGGELPNINPSGDWEPYLPVFEEQKKFGLETMNCVQFSRLNVCETQAGFYNKPLNLSDRFLYWATGCTERGNTFSSCDFWFKNRGSCDEDVWPWTTPLTREQYGAIPPLDVQEQALTLLFDWDIGMLVWVGATLEAMRAALRKGPLWFCNSGHAMEIYRIDDAIRVFDTYQDGGNGRGEYPLSYVSEIVACFLAPFTPKNLIPAPMITLPPNSLVIVVDNGERLMNVDGTKLYKDDAGKILLEVVARNAGADGSSRPFPIVHVKAADVANVSRVNLKGEPVV